MSAVAATISKTIAIISERRKSCPRSLRMDSKERPVFSQINASVTANTNADVTRTAVKRTMLTRVFEGMTSKEYQKHDL